MYWSRAGFNDLLLWLLVLWVPTDLGGQYPTESGGAHLLTNVGHVFGICLLIGVTLNADKGGQALFGMCGWDWIGQNFVNIAPILNFFIPG